MTTLAGTLNAGLTTVLNSRLSVVAVAARSALTGSAQTCRLRTAQPAERPAPRLVGGFRGQPAAERQRSGGAPGQPSAARASAPPAATRTSTGGSTRTSHHPSPDRRRRPGDAGCWPGRLPPSTAPQGAPFRLRCRPSASLRVAHRTAVTPRARRDRRLVALAQQASLCRLLTTLRSRQREATATTVDQAARNALSGCRRRFLHWGHVRDDRAV